MLSLVFNGELRADNIIFMPDEIGENFTIESVNEPHTEVFTACNQNWRLVMPLNEIHIVLWNAIKSLFECEVILNVPDAQEIVHSACDEPFPG